MTLPTIINRSELRRKAEAATPGPWCQLLPKSYGVWCGHDAGTHHVIANTGPVVNNERPTQSKRIANAEYIAACDPQTILSLLDALDEAGRNAAESDEAIHAICEQAGSAFDGIIIGMDMRANVTRALTRHASRGKSDV